MPSPLRFVRMEASATAKIARRAILEYVCSYVTECQRIFQIHLLQDLIRSKQKVVLDYGMLRNHLFRT